MHIFINKYVIIHNYLRINLVWDFSNVFFLILNISTAVFGSPTRHKIIIAPSFHVDLKIKKYLQYLYNITNIRVFRIYKLQ